jgi:hypothetical protein
MSRLTPPKQHRAGTEWSEKSPVLTTTRGFDLKLQQRLERWDRPWLLRNDPYCPILLKKSVLRGLMRRSRNHASSMAEKAECYCVIYPHQDREFRESSADRLFQQYRPLTRPCGRR